MYKQKILYEPLLNSTVSITIRKTNNINATPSIIPCNLLQNYGFSNNGCNHKNIDIFYRYYFIMQDNDFPTHIFWYTLHWYVSLVLLHSSVNPRTITESKNKLLVHTCNPVFSWKTKKLKPTSVESGPCRLSISHTIAFWTSNVSVYESYVIKLMYNIS